MSHKTYAIISFADKNEFYYFFLKPSDDSLEFFTHVNTAINGDYRHDELRAKFCKHFNIDIPAFEKFQIDEIPLEDNEEEIEEDYSIVKIAVDKDFFANTSNEKGIWIAEKEFKGIGKEEPAAKFPKNQAEILEFIFKDPLDIVELPADLLESITVILEAHQRRKLVVIAGAGISKDSGIPLWGETGALILESLGLPPDTNAEPTVVGQWLYNARGEKEYNDKIREILNYNRNPQPNPIHKELVSLEPKHIITTNFDDLIEKALEERQKHLPGVPYNIISKDSDFPYASTDRFIVKMHGDWNLMNFIFKEDDYLNYSKNMPLTESFVKGIFSSNLVLFIGFSFSDSNLKQIVNWVKEILGKDFQPAYLFLFNEPQDYEKTYFLEKGIKPVVWNEAIRKWLSQNRIKTKTNLSSKGQIAYEFLKFLQKFDLKNYNRLKKAKKGQHIIDQLYDALYVFNFFNSIPPYVFRTLYPFSPQKLHPAKRQVDASWDENGHLSVRNEQIIRLMRSLLIEKDTIKVKEDSIMYDEIISVGNFNFKLQYIFDKLKSSGIRCIHREGDYDSTSHHRILYSTNFPDDLLLELWSDFKIDVLLESIKKHPWVNKDLNNTDKLLHGILDGFILFELQYYAEAYLLFSSVSSEALKRGDFTTYFICQYNKSIAGRIIMRHHNWKIYSKEFVEQVGNDLENLNLEENLKVIQIEKSVKEILKGILDKSIFKKYANEIEKSWKQILDIYETYKNPGNRHSGGNYAIRLSENYLLLYWFYVSNGIIIEETEQFRELTKKMLEGLLASYSTNERYTERYKFFDSRLLLIACRFLNPKIFKNLFKKYNITEISFDEENKHKEYLVQTAINFFSSGYRVNSFFNSESPNDLFVKYLDSDSIYSTEEVSAFKNFLTALAHINFENLSPEITSKLIDTVFKCCYHLLVPKHLNEHQYLGNFILKHIKYFSNNQINLLLKVLAKGNGFVTFIIPALIDKFKQLYIEYKLEDLTILKELLKDEYPEERIERIQSVVFMYKFIHPELQEYLLQKVNNNLLKVTSSTLELYFIARLEGCISKESIPEYFLLEIKKQFEQIRSVKLTNDGFNLSRLEGYRSSIPTQLARIHYTQGLTDQDLEWFSNQLDNPYYFQWLFSPDSFDYEQFDPYWLFFLHEDMIQEIRKKNIPELKLAMERGLKKKYSDKLAKIYFNYFVDNPVTSLEF